MIFVSIRLCDANTVLAPAQIPTLIQANLPNVSLSHFELLRCYRHQPRVGAGRVDASQTWFLFGGGLSSPCNSLARVSSHGIPHNTMIPPLCIRRHNNRRVCDLPTLTRSITPCLNISERLDFRLLRGYSGLFSASRCDFSRRSNSVRSGRVCVRRCGRKRRLCKTIKVIGGPRNSSNPAASAPN